MCQVFIKQDLDLIPQAQGSFYLTKLSAFQEKESRWGSRKCHWDNFKKRLWIRSLALAGRSTKLIAFGLDSIRKTCLRLVILTCGGLLKFSHVPLQTGCPLRCATSRSNAFSYGFSLEQEVWQAAQPHTKKLLILRPDLCGDVDQWQLLWDKHKKPHEQKPQVMGRLLIVRMVFIPQL